ncbi:nicotinate-nucleotide adenylyltransferase [Xylella fastidiosa]|uniref:Probable nicotinate-nucleotide adenylyltransferase n=1 Tax=Xylella fastidiosa subsp. fastidiosa TaxID=644356 RepID=A0AAJ5R1C1_XYLFS|nr:nicotinate-nucleotide adenylyltransferase [Xylella fastidiosa]WCF27349.1 nicotinate-nucleotide adenylyltransferase [Xylella fastidiosa subsp. fastidiosa]
MPSLHIFYGGTFDPVHVGHLAIARAAHAALQAPIALIPSADPPHRLTPGSSSMDRLRMLQLAVSKEPGLSADPRELRRAARQNRPSYTVDTLTEVRSELGPKTSIIWLLGADAFVNLSNWKDWQMLPELTHLVVANRPGITLQTQLPPKMATVFNHRWVQDPATLRKTPHGHLWLLNQHPNPSSASKVRAAISAAAHWEADLTPEVAQYIRTHGLYGIHDIN